MIKLKRFLEDPLGAYDIYKKDYLKQNQQLIDENKRLKRQVKTLEQRNKQMRSYIDKTKNIDRDFDKVVRTLHWHYTGEKLQKGREWDYLIKIRDEHKEIK